MKKSISIIIIGDGGVGKTSLLKCYDGKEFTNQHVRTVGVDAVRKQKQIDGVDFQARIWDTAGQERFKNLTQQFYRQADGIIVAFDLSNEESFKNVKQWIQSIYKNCDADALPKLLCGNKCDLLATTGITAVNDDTARAQAAEYGMSYHKTSARTKENVENMFEAFIKQVFEYKLRP